MRAFFAYNKFMQQLRDLSGVPGVAHAKTSNEVDMRARLTSASSDAGFASPEANVGACGLREGMTVADFGSGSGAYTIAAARIVGRTGKVFSVEVQKDLLSRTKSAAAREHLENIEYIWGDFERAEGSRIANHSVDRVIMSNVLFQLDNHLGALYEACRVLKPGGLLALIDWSDSFGGMGPTKDTVVTKTRALQLASSAGFAAADEFPAGSHHYGLLFRPLSAKSNETQS